MKTTHRVTALAVALLLPLTLAACGSGEDEPSTAAETAAAGETSTATEEAAEETPTATPTTDAAAAEPALGDWCAALEGSVDEMPTIIPDEGEWTVGRPAEAVQPQDGQNFTEGVVCALRLGEGIEALTVGVAESQYEDEAAAGTDLAALRDDPDPMAATEDVDFGDEAIYTTYDGQMGMPPFVSFSVSLREGDRLVRVSIRDHATDPAPDEQSRRDQVVDVVELLQGP